ncbi:hypothetical protein PanWU01x14_358330 [Parasponia andersonii]|uniref:RNase H type-1 domain-containing protein n=1 Tax=Parasponia andersonii TaxID=3476 RepID=A0A2P5A8A9_PARAD|nr:hypothetical protein PanWU01x14_358330 [Parasponia andersonii]
MVGVPLSGNIHESQPRQVSSLIQKGFPSQGYYLVVDFILLDGNWDFPKLLSTFDLREISAITCVILPSISRQGNWIWAPSFNGCFSIKSAYLGDQHERFHNASPISQHLWNELWAAKLQHRHKVVGGNAYPKTIGHLFIICDVAKHIWFSSSWNLRPSQNYILDLAAWFSPIKDSITRWLPPPDGWLKINFDVGIDENFVVVPVVCRDCSGAIMAVETRRFDCSSPLVDKCRAALTAIELAISKKISHLILKRDAQIVINSLNGIEEACPWKISNLVFDCFNLLHSISVWKASFSLRLSNWLAHNLAQWACFFF